MEQSSLHQSSQFSDNGAPERAPSIKEKIDQKKKKKAELRSKSLVSILVIMLQTVRYEVA